MPETRRDNPDPQGLLLPTPSPNVQQVSSLVAQRISKCYDSLMEEILSSDQDDPLERASKLIEASGRLGMLLAEVDRFDGPGTEMWLQGVDMGLTTSSPEIIQQALEESENPGMPDIPNEVGFLIPAEDGVQCFFDSFTIDSVFDATSDEPEAIIPYALGMRVANALATSADSSVKPLFIPGFSTIVPTKFEALQMGIVVKD
ncbi:MAG TPA: hypothetical protein PKA29_01025 [Candidatus Saccharibacteria bacterium]|nr:hypothetical protein [Candidatus Saccharibacteria bacterium]